MIGNPLGLLALLSIPTIIAIHYFRRRFEPKTIAGLFLWRDPDQDPSSGRRLHRIENRTSLWLELLLALVASLYLMDLQFDRDSSLNHEVIVLDSTASMGAVQDDYDTAEAAREKIRAILEDSGADSLVTIVADSVEPVVLAGPAASSFKALEALEEWRPIGRSGNSRAGIALAREIASTESGIHYISDRMPEDDPPAGVTWHALGRSHNNAALLNAIRKPSAAANKEDVVVVAASWGLSEPIRVTVKSSGEILGTVRIATDGRGAPKAATLEVDKVDGPLDVLLDQDGLEVDNALTIEAPVSRDVTFAIQDDLDDDIVDSLRRALLSVGRSKETSIEEAQLVFGRSLKNENLLPSAWLVGIGPFEDAKMDTAVSVELGPFLVERAHPLMKGLGFAGVIWPANKTGGEGFRGLVNAGESILIGEKLGAARPEFRINIEMKTANLQQSLAWPVFVYNLVEFRRTRIPGVSRQLVAVGESLAAYVEPTESDRELSMIDPEMSKSRVIGIGHVMLGPMNRLGSYRVESKEGSWATWQVHFRDAGESNLLDANTGTREDESGLSTEKADSASLVDPRLHFGLLFAGLCFFVLNAVLLKWGKTS